MRYFPGFYQQLNQLEILLEVGLFSGNFCMGRSLEAECFSKRLVFLRVSIGLCLFIV